MGKEVRTNYAMLLGIHESIHNHRMKDPGGAYLNRDKIKQWYDDNGVRVKSLADKKNALIKEFFEWENEATKLDNTGNPILLPGKTMEEWNDRYEKFIAQETIVIE